MTLQLPELPFAKDSLEPHMSSDTLDYHHGKHHNAYVVKGNELLSAAGISGARCSITWANATTILFFGIA
jgi:Fe-Mn family superoxide dismutase